MTLYFNYKVQYLGSGAFTTVGKCHPSEPIFAVAFHSQDRGGCVAILDDSGEPIGDVTFPSRPTYQATALDWHPGKKLLASGWENGEIHVWVEGDREFSSVRGPHKSPVVIIQFSEKGGRMVSADSMGLITGWRCSGRDQFFTMFSHSLRDTLLHITFRCTVLNSTNTELTNLARAAVAGDEEALDTLSNWRPRTASRNLCHSGVKDNHCFYVGTQSATILYINQAGTCIEVLKLNSPVIQMLWHPEREAIVALTEDLTVGHYKVESTGALVEVERMKLIGRIPGEHGAITWAGHLLAIITGDFNVRLWDIDTGDNVLLKVDYPATNVGTENISKFRKLGKSDESTEVFTCIAYCHQNHTLCGGTNEGNVYTWKRKTNFFADTLEDLWQLNNLSAVQGAIKHCLWGSNEEGKPFVILNCVSNVYILQEQPLIASYTQEIWSVQRSANQVYVEHANGKSTTVTADISITKLCLTDNNVVLSNGKTITTYKITMDDGLLESDKNLSVKQLQSFKGECLSLYIYDQNIVCLTTNDVKIYSLGGVVLKEIICSELEGKPIGCDLMKNFLSIFTMNGYIKLYDVSSHEPKILFHPKCCYDLFENFGEVIMAKSNSTGTQLAMIIANENLIPDGKMYVWNLEKDLVGCHDFLGKNTKNLETTHIPRLPLTIYWDTEDERIFAVETRLIQQADRKVSLTQPPSGAVTTPKTTTTVTTATSSGKSTAQPMTEMKTFVMFTTETCQIKELDSLNFPSGEKLVNLSAPHLIVLNASSLNRLPLRDFKGLETCDETTRKMILNFGLNVAQGNMDVAFRCVRVVQSEVVWSYLGRMSMETGRLDVAKVSLGRLKKSQSVRALRKAMADDSLEDEAKVASLAIELGFGEEAEALYKKCGRYDLLNKYLQARGEINEALPFAEKCDRVHLKSTYYEKAERLKEAGDYAGALQFYDKTQNPVKLVTQMLLQHPAMLEKYMQKTTNKKMLKWWGKYIESTGDMESAFKVYQKAEDWFSQVRVLCFLSQLGKADTIARQSKDRAACYHLARHYESIGKYQEAIQLYTSAQTQTNAVRICKENDLRDELWTVANTACPRDKAIAAAYFEQCGEYKRAVELYHRAGMLHKAVEMAFTSEQPETLEIIASELTTDSDPDLVNRCANFFFNIKQYHKAVPLLVKSKQYERALEICSDLGVPITESLAEMLTPTKEEMPEDKRLATLLKLGELLQEQGDYHTASKKFIQAGDKIRAMKSLLKSGDTDKIIYFAGMSRQREVYIMAANYLQAMDWQNDPKILKHIIIFYSKGQAYDTLTGFYARCAQAEIDEFHDYERAFRTMQEAAKCLRKLPDTEQVAENLQQRMSEVKQIVALQESLSNGENEIVIERCRAMLVEPERPPIRQVDILVMLIQALTASKNYIEAISALKELTIKDSSWSAKGLLQRSLVQTLANHSGLDFEAIWNAGRQDDTSNDVDSDEIPDEDEL